ncbi:MAG: ATP-binding protein [Candidatus Diapherotrites archaeon]|nr:ATP-binding protein [Candidatus Diapherotrites archaeon]
MISKSVLGTIIQDQLSEFKSLKGTVPRTLFKKAISYGGASAFVVKGVRRCGKSTLLKQIVKEKFSDNFLYFNFDDERITNFKTEDFQTLMEVFIELFGEKKNMFFDEIQNIAGWELFVNRLLRQGYHVFITGSNSNLLSKELGTHMTGRHVDIELCPFSFTEFLKAQKVEAPKKGFYSTENKVLMSKKFKEYLSKGGMPEVIVYSNEAVLTQILNDIIQKDIVTRHNVRKPSELKAVLNYLISNAANSINFRSMPSNFAIKSPNTIQKYVEYAEETYIVFTVKKFERKLKQFDKNPKKIYCIDTGIITKNTPSMREKDGDLLENVVAVHLKRLGKEFYYYKGKTGRETDFVMPREKQAIQVCYDLDKNNTERETKGLIEAMKELKTKNGLILTLDQEQEITNKKSKITAKPVWQWLIENDNYEKT